MAERDVRADEIHRSPSLAALAIVYTLIACAAIATLLALSNGASPPSPYRPLEELGFYYQRYPLAVLWASTLQFAAAIPLGLFTAVIVSRLSFLRIRVAGVHIALFGGISAAILLALSALCAWTLSQAGVAVDTGAMRVAQLFAFACGGFGHTVALGLLLAGVSVPSLAFGLMPRWIGVLGLIVAVVCELSIFAMLLPQASILIPLGRFPAFVWLIAAGFAMPRALREQQVVVRREIIVGSQ